MGIASTLIIQLASLAFFHAAYSAWEVKSYQKAYEILPETTFGSVLPLGIIIELSVSFGALLAGVLLSAAPLKPINWGEEMKTRSIDSEDSRLAFKPRRHRGTLLR